MSNKCNLHPVRPSPRCRICGSLSVSPELPKPQALELKKPEQKHGLMPIHGDKNTWNMSALMRKNVMSSAYFSDLFPMRDLSELVSELVKSVHSIEPWLPNSNLTPSPLFCILLKLFIMKLTEGQLRFMCDHLNPYVKIAAFLYIRFLSDPQELWERFLNYSVSTQQFEIKHGETSTIGNIVEKILTEQDFFGIQLPRIPAAVQHAINQKCSQLPGKRIRWAKNSEKEFEKNAAVVVYLDEVKNGVFKHREGNKVHVQVDGKDLHLSIGDIDDQYTGLSVAEKSINKVLADSRDEYMKKTISYKNALIYQIPSKRQREPSPEVIVVDKAHENKDAQIASEIYSLDTQINKKQDDALAEFLKLG